MKRMHVPRWQLVFAILVGILVVSLVGYRLVSGRSLGLRSWVETRWYMLSSVARVVADHEAVTAQSRGEFTNLVFLHHSVGDAIISQGGLRELLEEDGILLTDQDYIQYGLTGPDGVNRGYTLPIPGDNTDPDGLAAIFGQTALPLPLNAFSALIQYEVIVVKSCFPANYIGSDEKLRSYQEYYRSIRDVIDEHPEKLFVLLTIPPLNQASTSPSEAERARTLADWMTSSEFLDEHPNLAVFDLYGMLAGNDPGKSDFNVLKVEYSQGTDSHPNELANQTVAPLLADFLSATVERYRQMSAY